MLRVLALSRGGNLRGNPGLAPDVSVSHERIRDELSKMLTGGQARRAFELLDSTGLLVQVLPAVVRMKGVRSLPNTTLKAMCGCTRSCCSRSCPRPL